MLGSKLTKPKYLSRFTTICTKLSEQGSFFQVSQNESKKYFARIKPYKNLNISADSQLKLVKMSPRNDMLGSKLTKT